MSKRRKTTLNFRKKHPRLVGCFYSCYDSCGGHPVLVYFADSGNDIYYIQRFSTKPRKDRVQLKCSINPDSNNEQWLIKKPEMVGYDDIYFTEKYKNFRVHPSDNEIVKKYQKYNLCNKKMDGRCESQQGVSKQMPSSTKIIKTKTKKKNK